MHILFCSSHHTGIPIWNQASERDLWSLYRSNNHHYHHHNNPGTGMREQQQQGCQSDGRHGISDRADHHTLWYKWVIIVASPVYPRQCRFPVMPHHSFFLRMPLHWCESQHLYLYRSLSSATAYTLEYINLILKGI